MTQLVGDSLYEQIFQANYGVLSDDEQKRLRSSSVTVVGAGGVGGQVSIQLGRLGLGRMRVIDKDVFEYSNINRQMLSSVDVVGRPKAEIAAKVLRSINPEIEVDVHQTMVTADNSADLLGGTDVVIDCTDDLVSRVVVHRAARKLGVPSVWIAVSPPFRGAVMSLSPDGTPYEEALNIPSAGLELSDDVRAQIAAQKDGRAAHSVACGALDDWAQAYLARERRWAVVSPVAAIVGVLAAFEAMKVIIDRPTVPPVFAPRLVKVDLASVDMVKACPPPADGWRYEEL